jgi:hyperosmotically inducible periplasmic protein
MTRCAEFRVLRDEHGLACGQRFAQPEGVEVFVHINRFALTVAVLCSGSLASSMGLMAQEKDKNPRESTPSDNTKVNKRDRAKSEPTADQAKDNASDRELMKRIRQSLMDDKSLSTYAHNIKVIAQHGKVTLKGPVRSAEEKKTVQDKATEVAGAGNVVSKISIKPEKGEHVKPKS